MIPPFAPPGFTRAVSNSPELARILQVPRRHWTDAQLEKLTDELSAVLRKPAGSMRLRPIQAQFLYEVGRNKGGFGPIRVGGGKTLSSLLAPILLGSRRPLLLLPAKLVGKTERERRALSVHWHIPNYTQIQSYELLGRVQAAQALDQYRPDLIVADEAHKLKNPKAAVTKRVARYMKDNPQTRFVAMSGTITRRSLKDFAHILKWCFPRERWHEYPLPHGFNELEDWADALDEKTTGQRIDPGALVLLCSPEERTELDGTTAARKAFRRRLTETPGIVATSERFIGSSLTISAIETDMRREVDAALSHLRGAWETPDGWPCESPLDIRRHARELSLGLYYKWDPRPPEAWISARREWAKACREILEGNRRGLDSPLQVAHAVDSGLYPVAIEPLENWRRIRDTFRPNTVPVWIDDSVVKLASEWAMRAPGIVWCEHTWFAEKLANETKLAYYQREGRDRKGRAIEDHPPDTSLIASIKSNAEGRNLQKFNRNLIVSCPSSGDVWEQLLGRTHRDGQDADEVVFDVVMTSIEHNQSFWQAMSDARYIEATTGQAQKILYADVTFPRAEDIAFRQGGRWVK